MAVMANGVLPGVDCGDGERGNRCVQSPEYAKRVEHVL